MANKGRMIEVNMNSGPAQAYLVEAGEGGSGPALIVIHEWWGLNEHIKDISRRFADEGFTVLAPDLYGGKVTKDAEEAAKLMQGLDEDRAIETLNSAVAYLKAGNSGRAVGVTGFCMGGSFALLLACRNEDIKAAAPFYGDVPAEEELKKLSAPILFIGAENDPWITQEKMNHLKQTLAKYGKDGVVKIYEGVGHAFFNDTRPDAYDKQAAEDAWQRVTQFLSQHLK